MIAWLLHHLQAAVGSLGRLARAPLSTLLTVLVLGITLSLPAGLLVALDNLSRAAHGWDSAPQLSLFLTARTDDRAAAALRTQLLARSEVARVDYLSREAALAEFRESSALGPALAALGDNPLPSVLVVRPATGHDTPAALRQMKDTFARLPGVDSVALDLEWIQRLQSLLAVGTRLVGYLATLLALGLLLIVGNTIRLQVLNRRTEIEVMKLIGATDPFIRRPFLYEGLLHGLGGAVMAWFLVEGGRLLLSGPANELARLYGSTLTLDGLSLARTGTLLLAGALLGWLGARIAVARHLRDISPQ